MSTSEKRPPILGLDLGTSTCLACVWVDGKPLFACPDLAYTVDKREMLAYPGELMPSAFCDRDGKPLVGHRALDELRNPRYARNVVRNVKQLMHVDAERTVNVGGREYRPSQIVAQYVNVLVRAAELELELRPRTIREAVVTVPVNFSLKARLATERACKELGCLQQVQLVDEPVAAAYSLRLHERPGRQRVLVVDLGAGPSTWPCSTSAETRPARAFRVSPSDGQPLAGGKSTGTARSPTGPSRDQAEVLREDFDRLMTETTDYGCYDFRAAENAKQLTSLQMRNARMFDPAVPLDHRIVPLLVERSACPLPPRPSARPW
ncbi:MAG: Hsp70 family protein [Isosphaeraceae bacterium]